MRTGWYREAHVKSRPSRLYRSLLASRRIVLNQMRTFENVMRAVLRRKLGVPSRKAFAGRMRELAGPDAAVMPLVEALPAILEQLAHPTRRILDIAPRNDGVCRRLTSTPGVGPITALAFRATTDRPERFRRSPDVGAYLGLTPAR